MRRVFFLGIGLTTFLLGCALARLCTSKPVSPNYVFHVEVPVEKKALLDGIEATARGCGNGYAQGYMLPDGKKLGEGNSCYSSFRKAHTEMQVWLKEANQIIESVAPSKNKDELRSERVIASFPKDEFGNEWVRIMWVHESCIHWISAPNLDYALEFEKSRFNPYKFEEITSNPDKSASTSK